MVYLTEGIESYPLSQPGDASGKTRGSVGTTDELIGLITRVVTEAGGRVTEITRDGEKVGVELDGLPDGPMTAKQYAAVLTLLDLGVDCLMGR